MYSKMPTECFLALRIAYYIVYTFSMYIWAKSKCFFLKVYPACHSDANGIEPGRGQNMTDKHAAEYSRTVCWEVN